MDSTPQFTTGEAARALSLPLRTIDSWLSRRVLSLAGYDKPSTGHGDYRRLSRRTITKLAIVAELVAIGLSPTKAVICAGHFSDRGSHDREPGQLFTDGKTLLIVSGTTTKVVNAESDASLAEIQHSAALQPTSAQIVIDIGRIASKIDNAIQFTTHRNTDVTTQ